MKKSEFVAVVAEKAGLTQAQANAAVNASVEALTELLAKGDTMSFQGFGSFKVRERAARDGRSPVTGETIKIKACKSAGFKASSALKDALNK